MRETAQGTREDGAKGSGGCSLVAQEIKYLSTSLFSFLFPPSLLPGPPQPPLLAVYPHVIPASKFPSSSSLHHSRPSGPHSLNFIPTYPRDPVTRIWSP